jgi:hypothetical protein
MNETQVTYGTVVTMLLAGLGAFLNGRIMLVATHKEQMADKDRQLEAERERTELVRLAGVAREAAQQERIDQLFNRMIEAAGLIEKSARAVRR